MPFKLFYETARFHNDGKSCAPLKRKRHSKQLAWNCKKEEDDGWGGGQDKTTRITTNTQTTTIQRLQLQTAVFRNSLFCISDSRTPVVWSYLCACSKLSKTCKSVVTYLLPPPPPPPSPPSAPSPPSRPRPSQHSR